MNNSILITGVTNFDYYPKCGIPKYCKEGMENIILDIPEQKPDIECINEIKIDMCTDDYKIIRTILGPKILLYGCIDIQVIYTADNCQQSLHSAHFSNSFCNFILLKDFLYDRCSESINKIFIGVEDACVKSCDKRSIDLSVIYIMCPEFCKNILCGKCMRPKSNDRCIKDNRRNSCNDKCGYNMNIYNHSNEL